MTFDPMTAAPDDVISELLAARAELDEVFAGLTDGDLEEPGMTGVWNGRLTLVHIARWDEVTTEMITRDRLGILPGVNEYDDYEWWNLRWAEIDADIPLWAANARYETAHEAIVRTLRGFTPDEWTPLVRGWVREASLNHYRHHADTTRRWRATR
ncbi:MAG TPA: hypothetical protein VKZ61_11540 [Thermomicrobiales bacterium]|jgi:hypothetical protein|nr:hypothetical protein [Thermomicrobiales bacterium]